LSMPKRGGSMNFDGTDEHLERLPHLSHAR